MTRFIVATGLLSVLSALSLSTAAEDKAVEVTFKSGKTKQCDGVSYMSSDFPGLNFDVYHKFMAREKGVLDRHSWGKRFLLLISVRLLWPNVKVSAMFAVE